MSTKIRLYSASGGMLPEEYKLKKIEALIERHQAEWVHVGVSARLIHPTEPEIAKKLSMDYYDRCDVSGRWRVIQPAATNFRVLCAQLVMPR